MQSKRDQVQAHTFMMSRLTSGMLLANPDAPESPLSRTSRGVVFGLIVGVLISAGALVFGLISPGGNESWKSAKSLVVNSDTGARYLYVHGRLRPVRNYATALLVGGGKLQTSDVHTASLRGTPIGAPIGIPSAPDSVPARGDLDSAPWQVCSTVKDTQTDSTSSTRTAATTLVAGAPADGQGVGSGRGLLVRGPDKVTYLVWRGERMKLDKASGAATSLGYGSVTPRPVSAAFLDALVPGSPLTPPPVPGQGHPGPSLGGRSSTVGQVFQVRVPGSAPQYYLLRSAGLEPLTSTQAALVLGDPATRQKAYHGSSPHATVLGADSLKAHQAPGSEGRSPVAGGLPISPPKPASVPSGSSACARVQSGHGGTKVTTSLLPKSALRPVAQTPSENVTPACLRVDATVVRPGHGALVRALSASGTTVGNTTYLVTDSGAKYRVPSAPALESLKYSQRDVQAVPSPLLSMLPSGPDLNPSAAKGDSKPTRPSGCVTSPHGASDQAGGAAHKTAAGAGRRNPNSSGR
jgi:type VII secretion protein EccB